MNDEEQSTLQRCELKTTFKIILDYDRALALIYSSYNFTTPLVGEIQGDWSDQCYLIRRREIVASIANDRKMDYFTLEFEDRHLCFSVLPRPSPVMGGGQI